MSAEGRGRRRHEEHEEHEEHVNHEAWVIPYADVLTLLMALFLVLWALGDTNEEKTNIAAESFRRELGGRGGISEFDIGLGTGGGPLANGGVSVLEGAGPAPMAGDQDPNALPSAVDDQVDEVSMLGEDGVLIGVPPEDIVPGDPTFDPLDDPTLAAENPPGGGLASGDTSPDDTVVPVDPLDEIEQAVRDEAVGSGLSTSVGFRREARGLVVSIVSDSVLFAQGAAEVQASGITVLDVVADALADRPNSIIVEGHTDSRPISTAEFPSNWELSTARATSVLRFLTEVRGLDGGRLSAAGYADTRPLADADDPDSLARNRRVEIVVLGSTRKSQETVSMLAPAPLDRTVTTTEHQHADDGSNDSTPTRRHDPATIQPPSSRRREQEVCIMPDKKSSDTDDNQTDSGKGSKRLLPAAALCIVMLGGGYFVGTMSAGGGEGTPVAEASGETGETDAADAEEKAELGHLESLDAVNVNLQDGHFLRVAVTLELGEYDAGGGHGGEAEFPTAPAADLVLATFSGRQMSELATVEGREAARTQLLDAVVDKYGDKVVSLYFTEFVMQ